MSYVAANQVRHWMYLRQILRMAMKGQERGVTLKRTTKTEIFHFYWWFRQNATKIRGEMDEIMKQVTLTDQTAFLYASAWPDVHMCVLLSVTYTKLMMSSSLETLYRARPPGRWWCSGLWCLVCVEPATCLIRWITSSSVGVVTGLSASSICWLRMWGIGLFFRRTVEFFTTLTFGDSWWDSVSNSSSFDSSNSKKEGDNCYIFIPHLHAGLKVVCSWTVPNGKNTFKGLPRCRKFSSSPLQKFFSMKPFTSPHGCFLKRSSVDTLWDRHKIIYKYWWILFTIRCNNALERPLAKLPHTARNNTK